VQRGFKRFFIVREDVKASEQGLFFQTILEKINTTKWSYRKDFKKKRRKFGKKNYVVRDQYLADVSPKDFFGKKFSAKERTFFYETFSYSKWSKQPYIAYRFSEPWRFVLRVEPNIITKTRIKDWELERRAAEIERYLDTSTRRQRLGKLMDGNHRYRWDDKPKEKYRDPMMNRSQADVLHEFWPEPDLKIPQEKNPRSVRGFFVFGFMGHTPLISLAALSPAHTAPSMYPFHTSEVSVPAQWILPHGSHNVLPTDVHVPVGMMAA
jgi:hypothetical protein